MKPCMALCGVMPKDAMGLDFDECRELAAGMQLMCVEILLGRQRADRILEQDCRRKELKRRQENIAQRQPKERWTRCRERRRRQSKEDQWRGRGSVKQWEVEEPIAERATNNVAECVGFVSVLARLMRDPVLPTPRTIIVKGDSELVIGQIKGTKRCNETLRRYYDQAQNLLAKLHDRRTTIEPRQAAQAYSDSATAKGWAMRTALSRLGKIARVKAVHPALEMRVNHLTSLGEPILQGLNKRPQINNREAFEAVMRAFEVAAVRHVPKKMANKGRGDQSGHWEKAGVLTGSFRPQTHLPTGVATQRREVARHDWATHRRARGGGSRHLWDVLANAEKKKADAQPAGCRPGSSTNRPTAAAAAATTAATSTAATSRERTEEPAAQHQSIPHAGGDGRGTLPRDDEGRGEPGAVK
ncbi:hypothetical protein DIPPA_28281 [Diplonema papillatum]|nr:hypothetical protein DIPPA_28281 [Diplonema papillatum]